MGHRTRGGGRVTGMDASFPPFHRLVLSDLPDRFTRVKGKETEGGEKGSIPNL